MEKIKNFKHGTEDVYLSAIYDTTKPEEVAIIKQITTILSAVGWQYRDDVVASDVPPTETKKVTTLATIRERLGIQSKPRQTNGPVDLAQEMLGKIREANGTAPQKPTLDGLRSEVKDVTL